LFCFVGVAVLVSLYEQNDKPSSALEYVMFHLSLSLLLCSFQDRHKRGFFFLFWACRFIQQKLSCPSISEYEKLQAQFSDLQIRYNELLTAHHNTCKQVVLVVLFFFSFIFYKLCV
jgi:hypothetical protein